MPAPPTSSPEQFVQGAPVLSVPDVKATAAFYRDVLGFRWDFGDERYAVVWRENSAIHFAKGPSPPSGVQLFQWVRDVEACHRELVAARADVVVEPGDRLYGLRDFSVRDPNGVLVVFGQDL